MALYIDGSTDLSKLDDYEEKIIREGWKGW